MLNTKNFASLDMNALKRPVVSFHRIQYTFLHFYSKIKKTICLCITWIHIGYSLLALIKYIKRSYILTGQEERKKKKKIFWCVIFVFLVYSFFSLLSVRLTWLILLTYFIIQLIFATIYESNCTFWYYSWVILYYFMLTFTFIYNTFNEKFSILVK